MGRAEDMVLLNRLELLHRLNDDLQAGRDPYPRLKQEYEFWEGSENTLRGGAEELRFLDEILRALQVSRPAPAGGTWVQRLGLGKARRQAQAA